MRAWLRSSRRYGWTITFGCVGLGFLTLLIPDGPVRQPPFKPPT